MHSYSCTYVSKWSGHISVLRTILYGLYFSFYLSSFDSFTDSKSTEKKERNLVKSSNDSILAFIITSLFYGWCADISRSYTFGKYVDVSLVLVGL